MKNLPAISASPKDQVGRPALGSILGVADGLPPAERTRLLLLRVESAAFLPPPAWHDAVENFTGSPARASGANWLARPALCRELEDQLRIAIDELASRFFTIPPEDRHSQWNDLTRQSRFSPALRARLALLEPGLALGTMTIDATDDLAIAMMRSIARIFPVDAATRRQLIGEALGPMFDEPHEWEDAARRLARDRPEIAALVPEFVAAVAALCDPEREEARRREARARMATVEAEWDSQNSWYYELEVPQTSLRKYKYHLLGIFGILLALVLLFDFIFKPEPPARTAPLFPTYRPDDTLPGQPLHRRNATPAMGDFPPFPESERDSIERRKSP